MKKLLMLILLIPFVLQAQWNVRQNKGVVINGLNIRYSVHVPYTPPTPPAASTEHPITHDQYYVSHPNVANGDSIGEVHYLCTDSIFNDRSSGSYSWSIISGNVGTAYAITSNTGMLKVNNATNLIANGDYTLGVEISFGSDKDTASCYIEYRTGTEGTTLIYIDQNFAGGGNNGTFSNPYTNLTTVDDFGEFQNGMTVLLKRGTQYTPSWWNIDNQGNKIVLAAYGAGAKPILNGSTGWTYPDVEQIIKLGAYVPAGTGSDNVDDADSVVIMDMHFIGLDSDTYHHYAIYHENFSDNNEYHRLLTERCGNGNGTFDFLGEWQSNIKVRDVGIIDPWWEGSNDHWRAFKFESGGGVDVENVWFTYMRGPGIMCGLHDFEQGRDWGSIKYVYGDMANTGIGFWTEGAIQVRDQGVTVEWLATQDYGYGVYLMNYEYSEVGANFGDPSPRNFTLKHGRFIGPESGIAFFDENDAQEAGDFDSARFEDVAVFYPLSYGVNFAVNGTDVRIIDEFDLVNWLVVDAGVSAINMPDGSEIGDVRLYNGIAWNSTSTDIVTQAAMSGAIMRNLIYDDATSTSHWGTWGAENYDYGTDGDPFVNSAGGDYTTNTGETTIINSGFNVSRAKDILGNDIGTQDVSPFEYGGTNYNWTDIE